MAYLIAGQQKIELLDTQIKAFASRLPANPSGRAGMQRLEQSREWVFGDAIVHLLVRDSDGRIVFKSTQWPKDFEWPDGLYLTGASMDNSSPTVIDSMGFRGPYGGYGRNAIEHGEWTFETFLSGANRWRLGLFLTAENEYRILAPLAGVDMEMAALRWRLLWVLFPAMVLLAIGARLIAGRAIRPLGNIAEAAAKIVSGSFSERIEPAENAPEIDRIIGLLNRMLDCLETSYRQALRFSADASHELKTPLTLMQNTLVAQLESVPVDSDEAIFCTEMLEHLSRLKRISGGLLLLARADSGQLPLSAEIVDLAALCRDLCADAQALQDLPDVASAWQLEMPNSLEVRVDRTCVRTIMFNLLLNAVRYSGRPPQIEVTLWQASGLIRLRVCNNGEPILAADFERVFDRFYRGANRTVSAADGADSGTGLGLAIARELARVLDGDVVLIHSGENGTCFEFSFAAQPSSISR